MARDNSPTGSQGSSNASSNRSVNSYYSVDITDQNVEVAQRDRKGNKVKDKKGRTVYTTEQVTALSEAPANSVPANAPDLESGNFGVHVRSVNGQRVDEFYAVPVRVSRDHSYGVHGAIERFSPSAKRFSERLSPTAKRVTVGIVNAIPTVVPGLINKFFDANSLTGRIVNGASAAFQGGAVLKDVLHLANQWRAGARIDKTELAAVGLHAVAGVGNIGNAVTPSSKTGEVFNSVGTYAAGGAATLEAFMPSAEERANTRPYMHPQNPVLGYQVGGQGNSSVDYSNSNSQGSFGMQDMRNSLPPVNYTNQQQMYGQNPVAVSSWSTTPSTVSYTQGGGGYTQGGGYGRPTSPVGSYSSSTYTTNPANATAYTQGYAAESSAAGSGRRHMEAPSERGARQAARDHLTGSDKKGKQKRK
ncbi:hypothetical protein ACIQOU_29190 [Streptomyces sp. NPDC091279]|uniref:hypothetical protein n=1 Tax=unclassified Streptomyces TaxID=2593676 RepID=UPI00381F73F1